MNKKLVVVALLISFSLYLTHPVMFRGTFLPSAVKIKYDELSEKYENSIGAKLSYCLKIGVPFYLVEGNGGFYGSDHYYDILGREIGSSRWSDVGPLPKSKISLGVYWCTALSSTMQP